MKNFYRLLGIGILGLMSCRDAVSLDSTVFDTKSNGPTLIHFDKLPKNAPPECVGKLVSYRHEKNGEAVQCCRCLKENGREEIYLLDWEAKGTPIYSGIVKDKFRDKEFIELCAGSFYNFDWFVAEESQ